MPPAFSSLGALVWTSEGGRTTEEKSMSRYSRSRGFTLVELLVVIAIIGTLVALLLPAVQGARESARRAACQNNLHNLAIACQQYHDNNLSFPSGWIVNVDPTSGSALQNSEGWGWGALLLPYLDQRNLHKDLAVTSQRLQATLAGNNPNSLLNGNVNNVKNLVSTPLKIYICPSDTGAQGRGQVDQFRAFQGLGASSGVGAGFPQCISNYLGVAGHRRVTGTSPNTGVFFGNSYIRMADIPDGTSNTAIIGERDTQYCKSGSWVGTENTWDFFYRDVSIVTGYDQPRLNAPPDPNTGNTLGPYLCGEGFSSLHVGGAQFAFADGSVRYVTNGVGYNYVNLSGGIACTATSGQNANDHRDPRNGVYQRMMSRSDKLPPGDLQ